jgi:ribose 1,5-bisphosphokinase
MSAAQPSAAVAPERIGPGRLLLLVGPSGAGKDTLLAAMRAACADDAEIVFPRRVVTRPATESEEHDSLREEAFDCAVQNGVFAFWWQAHGLKYALPLTLDDDIRAGRTVLCNVSRAIVEDLRGRYARVEAVLVTAPPEVLTARLAGRARLTDGSLAERLARNEGYADFRADHVIDNSGSAEAACTRLIAVIR